MAEKDKNSYEVEPLILQTIYPDAAAIFSFQPPPLQAVLSECLIVLDTNVLLIPYGTGRESLEQIRKTYSALASQRRLFIPGQVAREFAKNRSEKLKTVFRQISLKQNTTLKRDTYPLLESVPEYQEIIKLEEGLESQLRSYRTAVGQLLDAISSWYWNDPVSTLYRDLFDANVIHDLALNKDVILKDLQERNVNKVPPGYKDAGKDDGGIGDLVIWNTILELGKTRGANIVLVSGDEKSDWWHKSDSKPLFPRFELIDEFRRASDGRSFYIISFAKLLELFGASNEVVQEVREEEVAVNLEGTSRALHAALMARAVAAERAVFRWLSKSYPEVIPATGGRFDFLVPSDNGSIAFKVRYVQRLRRDDLKVLEHRLSYSQYPDLARAYVVVVADDQEIIEKAVRLMARLPRSPQIGRVFGYLDEEGEFRHIFAQQPPEGPNTEA